MHAPWEGRSRGLTQEFEAFALTLMREMPVKKAGEILGETDQKLWRALFAHVAAAWTDLSWENVTWVGADEMNRKKGHNYLTVFADLQAKRVLLAPARGSGPALAGRACRRGDRSARRGRRADGFAVARQAGRLAFPPQRARRTQRSDERKEFGLCRTQPFPFRIRLCVLCALCGEIANFLSGPALS